MDLNAIATSATAVAVGIASQALKPITLTAGPGQGAYDPATDKNAGVATYNLSALFYQTRDQKLTEDADRNTAILIRVVDLAALGMTGRISDGDTVKNNEDGYLWTVHRVDQDPVGANWILQARR